MRSALYPCNTALIKEIVRDKYHADIPVMTAFREQVTHLLRINVVQQIVEDHEARSAVLRIAEFLGDALVEKDISPFLLRGGDSRSLAITPDNAACKMALGAEGNECRRTTCLTRWTQ